MRAAFTTICSLTFQISSALKAKLSPGEAARLRQPPTQNGEAYVLYVQANDYLARREKLRPDLEKGEQLYERAVKLDPTFALAYAQLWKAFFIVTTRRPRRAARKHQPRLVKPCACSPICPKRTKHWVKFIGKARR